jgi:hypothetical protein
LESEELKFEEEESRVGRGRGAVMSGDSEGFSTHVYNEFLIFKNEVFGVILLVSNKLSGVGKLVI